VKQFRPLSRELKKSVFNPTNYVGRRHLKSQRRGTEQGGASRLKRSLLRCTDCCFMGLPRMVPSQRYTAERRQPCPAGDVGQFRVRPAFHRGAGQSRSCVPLNQGAQPRPRPRQRRFRHADQTRAELLWGRFRTISPGLHPRSAGLALDERLEPLVHLYGTLEARPWPSS
jgi:hypothetical protein